MPPILGRASGVKLDERDEAFLSGYFGDGPALAMRVLIDVAEAMGAPEFIDISRAHVDGCFYIQDVSASLDFAERLEQGGARVRVPTTVNVGSVDLLHPELWRGPREMAVSARRLMDAYAALGCTSTWTCAPYQLPDRPEFGEQIAWGESNAIVFANSVLGARTQRYGDFVDIAAAIVGRAPLAGLHTDAGRRGQVLIRVEELPSVWRDTEILFPLLGHVIGRFAGSRIPVVTGVESASEDDLKALGAAAASTGSVALFHLVGITPEAPTLDEAFGGLAPEAAVTVGEGDLRRAWDELSSATGGQLAGVCIGTPHFSVDEFRRLAELLDGRSVHERTPLYVSTGRGVLEAIIAAGLEPQLRSAGVTIVTDTCTYNTPILGKVQGLVMTNSAKWAWYAPASVGAEVVFAPLRACVESAVAGRIVGDPLA